MKQTACLKVDLSEYIERLKAASETLQSALSSEDKDFDEQSVETIEKAKTAIAEICTLCECISKEEYSADTFGRFDTLFDESSKLSSELNLNQGVYPQELHPMTDKGINLLSACEEAIKDGKTCANELRGKVAPLRARISYLESCEKKISQRITGASGLIALVTRIVQSFLK